MNKRQKPSQKMKGATVAAVLCFVAAIAIVGTYTFNDYKRTQQKAELARVDEEDRTKYFVDGRLPRIIYVLPPNFRYSKDNLIFNKESEKKRILKTIEATERFVLCASIAMGLTQMIALTPDFAETVRTQRYLRTSSKDKVSEATVLDYLRKNIFRLLYLNRHSGISRLILRLQAPVFL